MLSSTRYNDRGVILYLFCVTSYFLYNWRWVLTFLFYLVKQYRKNPLACNGIYVFCHLTLSTKRWWSRCILVCLLEVRCSLHQRPLRTCREPVCFGIYAAHNYDICDIADSSFKNVKSNKMSCRKKIWFTALHKLPMHHVWLYHCTSSRQYATVEYVTWCSFTHSPKALLKHI